MSTSQVPIAHDNMHVSPRNGSHISDAPSDPALDLVHLMMLAGRAGYQYLQIPGQEAPSDTFASDNHVLVITHSEEGFGLRFRTLHNDDSVVLLANDVEVIYRALALIFSRSIRLSYRYAPIRTCEQEIPESTPLVRKVDNSSHALLSFPEHPGLIAYADPSFWNWKSMSTLLNSFHYSLQDFLLSLNDPYARPLTFLLENPHANLPFSTPVSDTDEASAAQCVQEIFRAFVDAGGVVETSFDDHLFQCFLPEEETSLCVWVYHDRFHIWTDIKGVTPGRKPILLATTSMHEHLARILLLVLGPKIRKARGDTPLKVPTEHIGDFFVSRSLSDLERTMAFPQGQVSDVVVLSSERQDGSPRFFSIEQLMNVSYYSPYALLDAYTRRDGGHFGAWLDPYQIG